MIETGGVYNLFCTLFYVSMKFMCVFRCAETRYGSLSFISSHIKSPEFSKCKKLHLFLQIFEFLVCGCFCNHVSTKYRIHLFAKYALACSFLHSFVCH